MVAKQNKIEAVDILPSLDQKAAKETRGVAAPFGWLEENRCHDTDSLIAVMPKHVNKTGVLVDQQSFLYSGRSNAMFILLPFIVADGIVKFLASLNPIGFNFVEFVASGSRIPALAAGAVRAKQKQPLLVAKVPVAKVPVVKALAAVRNFFAGANANYLNLLQRKGHLPVSTVFDGSFLRDLVEGDSFAFYAGVDRERTANDNVKAGKKGKFASKAA